MKANRKRLIGLIAVLTAAHILHASYPGGIVREGLTIRSAILNKKVRYTVYLPFDYETSSRWYPVVYLLHGYTDNDMGWIQFGEAHLLADEAISERIIPPMILIMPDGGVSFYINNYDGSVRYEDFFFEEFIPEMERIYRIRPEKRYRGIAGLSMGGYGAILYALKHPDMFSACAAFSAAVTTPEDIVHMPDEFWDRSQGILYGPDLADEERLTPHFLSNNPVYLVRHADPVEFKDVRLYLDCGDDDFLSRGNAALHIALKEKGIRHEFRVRDGMHQWSYWRSGLVDGLKFIGTDFHQP